MPKKTRLEAKRTDWTPCLVEDFRIAIERDLRQFHENDDLKEDPDKEGETFGVPEKDNMFVPT